jgi:hypothetical protein
MMTAFLSSETPKKSHLYLASIPQMMHGQSDGCRMIEYTSRTEVFMCYLYRFRVIVCYSLVLMDKLQNLSRHPKSLDMC